MSNNDQTLTIVVNGQQTEVEVSSQDPLRTAVEEALQNSSNTGRPIDDWELKDINGNSYDLNKKIGEFDFTATFLLFLDLKAGIGG